MGTTISAKRVPGTEQIKLHVQPVSATAPTAVPARSGSLTDCQRIGPVKKDW